MNYVFMYFRSDIKIRLLEYFSLLLRANVPQSGKEIENNVLFIEKCIFHISFITYVLDTRKDVLYDKN